LALAEDLSGNLWIATKKGLYRKQGGVFTKYTTAEGLVHDHVAGLHVARDGSLWVATHGGLNRLKDGVLTGYPLTETVHNVNGEPEAYHQILTVTDDSAGNTWVGTVWGLKQFDTVADRYRPVWSSPLLRVRIFPAPTQVVFVDRGGFLWCGTEDVLVRREGDSWREFQFEADGGDIRLRRIVQAADGTIWVVRAGKLFHLQGDTLVREDERLGLADSYVTDVLFTREGIVWVGTRFRGLQCLRPATLRVFTTRDGLCHNGVMSVSPSRVGGLWVGTERGLMRLHNGNFVFPEANGPVTELVCRAVFEESNGDLWVGTSLGPGGHIYCLEKGPAGYRRLRAPNTAQEHAALFEDGHRRLWVGGRAGFACLLPDDVAKLQGREDYNPVETLHRPSRWIFEPSRIVKPTMTFSVEFATNLWRYVGGGVPGWMPLSAAPAEYLADAPIRLDQHLSSYDVRAILEDRHGDLWFGTWGGGLNRVRDRRIDVFTARDGLAGDRIQALHQDAEGVLWIGTTEGLSRQDTQPSTFNPQRFFSFTTAHGLPDNRVNQILEDDAGHLWIGCDEGIYRVAKRELAEVAAGRAARVECLLLDEQDGLLGGQTHSGSQPSACKTPDGRLWFATPHGLAMLDPARVSRRDSQPKVFIERLRVGDASIELLDEPDGAVKGARSSGRESAHSSLQRSQSRLTSAATLQGSKVQLSAGSGRSIEFEFTALEYFAPKRLRFRYKLEGFDQHWQDVGSRRTAFYTNLKPGQYRFEVRAGGRDGRWTDPGTSLAFIIAPFFWETRWFWAGSGTGVSLFLSGFLYWRFRRWQHRKEREKREALTEQQRIQHLEHVASLAQERDRLARDLHDELAGELTRIALLEQRDAAALPLLRRAAEIARAALDSLGELIWATDPSYDTLDNLAAYLRQLTLRIMGDTGLATQFEFPETVPPRRVTAQFRRELVLLVKEALTNAARHAGATAVTVGLKLTPKDGNGSPDRLELWVQDNGRGFDATCVPAELSARGNAGHGLPNMRRRVTNLGGEFSIEATPGQGTVVRARVPLPENE
ncbi:MAG: two-component regulator propeller domain-containing protein, partial [Verrucomicrobiota bacterium]